MCINIECIYILYLCYSYILNRYIYRYIILSIVPQSIMHSIEYSYHNVRIRYIIYNVSYINIYIYLYIYIYIYSNNTLLRVCIMRIIVIYHISYMPALALTSLYSTTSDTNVKDSGICIV